MDDRFQAGDRVTSAYAPGRVGTVQSDETLYTGTRSVTVEWSRGKDGRWVGVHRPAELKRAQ
jgi:hypothetical protein